VTGSRSGKKREKAGTSCIDFQRVGARGNCFQFDTAYFTRDSKESELATDGG
jgi:hypothetical protein